MGWLAQERRQRESNACRRAETARASVVCLVSWQEGRVDEIAGGGLSALRGTLLARIISLDAHCPWLRSGEHWTAVAPLSEQSGRREKLTRWRSTSERGLNRSHEARAKGVEEKKSDSGNHKARAGARAAKGMRLGGCCHLERSASRVKRVAGALKTEREKEREKFDECEACMLKGSRQNGPRAGHGRGTPWAKRLILEDYHRNTKYKISLWTD